ncbi:uncharacterized protein LOC116266218 [Nymphaea colorata]|nr:uncharacterized protein LOC116266218 [Nymphaea colorata]
MRQMIGARIKGASSLIPPINSPATLGRVWVAAAKRDRCTNSHGTDKDGGGDVTHIIPVESHDCWVPHPVSGMFVPPGALAVKGGSGNVTIRHDPSVSKVWVRSTETMEDKDYSY